MRETLVLFAVPTFAAAERSTGDDPDPPFDLFQSRQSKNQGPSDYGDFCSASDL